MSENNQEDLDYESFKETSIEQIQGTFEFGIVQLRSMTNMEKKFLRRIDELESFVNNLLKTSIPVPDRSKNWSKDDWRDAYMVARRRIQRGAVAVLSSDMCINTIDTQKLIQATKKKLD